MNTFNLIKKGFIAALVCVFMLNAAEHRVDIYFFYADWYEPSVSAKQTLKEASKHFKGKFNLHIYESSVSKHRFDAFNIDYVPEMKAYFRGEELSTFKGKYTIAKIKAWAEAIYNYRIKERSLPTGRSVELSTEDFHKRTELASDGYFVYFFTHSSAPCRSFSPIYEKAAAEFVKNPFVKVNATASPQLVKLFAVSSVPHIAYVENGKVIDVYDKIRISAVFRNWCRSMIK